MNTLLILNDAPYGSERTYNGARLAGALARQSGNEVRVFLIGDAAAAAHRLQKVPTGFYNLEVMLGSVVSHAGVIGVCGTCMDARGISVEDLIPGAHRSTLDELTQWTDWADKVLVF
ncbi:MAG: DsrE family protein [Polaromonas sp.]|uniref:DsrE/DsrF/TusD sulfur relay family protein n=1 Tax=Polaromonas sp. TaxID=1869339 RepID=UPI002731AA1B|nr:DsrE family protein [Polaromonas sp.]MDP2448468.1 DsrE family protein [Polaromonas sp.]MDP3249162.1 DsrE family protein [Polaromonas sp.]MDP3755093.1 DsrE family protein [Polaromonas sp.]MDP3827693.1 DsrE family protein [Polaromonas sp.]